MFDATVIGTSFSTGGGVGDSDDGGDARCRRPNLLHSLSRSELISCSAGAGDAVQTHSLSATIIMMCPSAPPHPLLLNHTHTDTRTERDTHSGAIAHGTQITKTHSGMRQNRWDAFWQSQSLNPSVPTMKSPSAAK